MIKKYFTKNKEFKDINLEIINTGQNSSIANRVFKIKKYIKSENFILLNGDAIFMFNIKKFSKITQIKNIILLSWDVTLILAVVW